EGYKGDLMVDKTLSRAEACVLLAELYGEKEEASKYTRKSTFSDIDEKEWYAPFVNYAQKREWFAGYPDGRFGPNDSITVQAWATLMLKVLNRFDTWENAVSDLKKVGVRIYAVDASKMKRGEAFDAMWAVVNQPAKGDKVSLGVKLGKLKAKDAEIVGTETPSLKMIELKVSDKLDRKTAEDPSSYQFLNADDEVLEIDSVVYDENADKVSVVFKNILKENTRITISELGVKTAHDGNLLIGDFGVHTVKDGKAPEIVEMVSLGTKAIKVVFSEPISGKDGELSKSNDFIFDRQLSVKRVFLTEDDTVAIIELNTSTVGTLSVFPQRSIRDYSGYALISEQKKYSVDMKPDASDFFIEKVLKVSPVELVVKLNKNMALSSRKIDGFWVGNAKADSNVELRGNILKLSFKNHYLPVGKATFVIKRNALNDYSGVSNQEAKIEIDVPADKEIPVSEGVVVEKQNQIRIPFNEPLKKTGSKLLSKSNYKLIGREEDVSKLISSVNYDSSNYTIIINTSKDLLGDYRIELQEVLDLSGNDGATYYEFTVGDVTPPSPSKWNARLYYAGGKEQLIVIKFDEAMKTDGIESVLNSANYMYGNLVFDKLHQDKLDIILTGNGDVVEIRYPGQRYGGTDFEAGGSKKLSIARVADLAGNKVDGFINSLSLDVSSSMTIEKAYLVDADMIEFEVKDEVVEFDANDIVFESGGKRLTGSYENVETFTGLTKFKFKLDSVTSHSITVKTVRGNSKNNYGDSFKTTSPIVVVDKIGPKLLQFEGKDDVSYNKNTRLITLVFNEDLNSKVVSLLSFEIPGIKIEEISVYRNELRILIAAEDRLNVTMDHDVIQSLELRDNQGNVTEGIVTRITRIK
ncbi:MAG: S-layer homology domain-containing protein, partial [Bacillota bacterium]|nr:S-layer homology domain-containing protein [Bacillota bacterium]